jgi:hypothetical protein
MSIDIDLIIHTGKDFAVVFEVGNMTHNVQPMWRKAIKTTSDRDMNLCDFNSWVAFNACGILEKALEHMQYNENEYTPLNPSNGWGDYDSAVEYLESFLVACKNHPACIIRTDC